MLQENTSLPENPDYEAANELLIDMNKKHICNYEN